MVSPPQHGWGPTPMTTPGRVTVAEMVGANRFTLIELCAAPAGPVVMNAQ